MTAALPRCRRRPTCLRDIFSYWYPATCTHTYSYSAARVSLLQPSPLAALRLHHLTRKNTNGGSCSTHTINSGVHAGIRGLSGH